MNIFIALFSGIEDPESTNGSIPCFYESVIRHFQNDGHNLLISISKVFMQELQVIPKDLLQKIKDFNPDLCLFFNNTFYDISEHVDCPIAIYDVDTPIFYSNKPALKANIDRYKFIVSQEESAKMLKDEFNAKDENILTVPFFTEIQAEDLPHKHNICFLGSRFIGSERPNIYNRFMETQPSHEEIQVFKKAISIFRQTPLMTQEELLTKLGDVSEKVRSNLILDMFLHTISDEIRVKTLSTVADLGLGLYGTPNWAFDSYNEPSLILNYNRTFLYTFKHNQDLYNSSKIGININHLQAASGFSWRVCDILASNACLVSEYKPNIVKYFAKANVPTFTNPAEAYEICSKLLKNENMRKDIVAASQEIINSQFRFDNVRVLLEDFLNINLKNNSSGSIEYIVLSKKTKKIKLKHKIYLAIYNKLHKKLTRKGLVR